MSCIRSGGAEMVHQQHGPLDPVSVLGGLAGRLAKDPARETLHVTADDLSEYFQTLPGDQPPPDPQVIMADLRAFVDEKGVEISAGDGRPTYLRRVFIRTDQTGLLFEKGAAYRPEGLDA